MNQNASRFYIIGIILVSYAALVAIAHFLGNTPLHLQAPFYLAKLYKLTWPAQLKWSYFGVFTILFIGLIFNPFRDSYKIHGNARFAGERDIKDMGLRALEGMILGSKNGKWLRMDQPLSVLIYAPPGTGKTAAIIIPTLLVLHSSVIVHDTKGELLEKTGPWRSQFSRVVKFAPGERGSSAWNPLAASELPNDWDDIEVQVGRIAEVLLPLPKKVDTEHWILSARNVFMFWALYLIHSSSERVDGDGVVTRRHEFGHTSFREILNRAVTNDPQGAVEEILLEEDLPSRIVLEGNSIMAKPEREFGSVLSTFDSKLSVFKDPRVAENTERADIRLKDMRKERTSVYVVVSRQDQNRLRPLLRLMFEMAANTFISTEKAPGEHDITLVPDEFVQMGQMDEVKGIPAIGRSYGLHCVFVVQTLAQLEEIYGKSGAQTMRGICAYQIFFTQNEEEVASQLSRAIGNRTVKQKSRSGRLGQDQSTTRSETGVPLMRPDDITSLPAGELLILSQHYFNTPILAKAAFWFKDRNLKKAVEFDAGDYIDRPRTVGNEVEA